MMNWFTRTFLMIVAASMISFIASPTYAGTFYPDDGDLWYDGFYFADSYLTWNVPGGWSVSDPGYEHDFSIRSHYFTDCTTWTDLPSGYDDCPTAGWTEPSNLWTFSFGSFHSRNILAGREYYGSWNFSGGYSSSTDFRLTAQENYRQFCWWDSIWCMGSTGQYKRLTYGWMYWATQMYRIW